MQGLIEQFVKEKQYLKNATPKTVRFYHHSLNALVRTIGNVKPLALTKALLNECIIKWCEDGLSPMDLPRLGGQFLTCVLGGLLMKPLILHR